MYDNIVTIGKSKIQHGKNNNRIYLMHLHKDDYPTIIGKMESLASKNDYTKIFSKIPKWAIQSFAASGYIEEAVIPKFYYGKHDTHFFSKFINGSRANSDKLNQHKINKIIQLAISKKDESLTSSLKPSLRMKVLNQSDIMKLAELYRRVFRSYPFPIFEQEYLLETMNNNVLYMGVFSDNNLIAASSAEMDITSKNAEMTDFATLQDFRGNNLSLFLLNNMESEMFKRDIRTLYTIARSVSFGMNITFGRMGYKFAGTLVNNTHIAGKIESMNVWYKHLTIPTRIK